MSARIDTPRAVVLAAVVVGLVLVAACGGEPGVDETSTANGAVDVVDRDPFVHLPAGHPTAAEVVRSASPSSSSSPASSRVIGLPADRPDDRDLRTRPDGTLDDASDTRRAAGAPTDTAPAPPTTPGAATTPTRLATPTTPTTSVPATTVVTTSATAAVTAAPTTVPALPEPIAPPVDAYAPEPRIEVGSIAIPAIDVDATMFEGIRQPTLDLGPAHWPGTAMPGQIGNVVVAGHRVSSPATFRRLDELVPGDEIVFGPAEGEPEGAQHVYVVTEIEIVTPDALWIVEQTPSRTATLFACHPAGSTSHRIVIHAESTS